MVKNWRVRIVSKGRIGIRNDLFREIEALVLRSEDSGGAADASRFAIRQKAVQRGPIAAQDRRRNLRLRCVAQSVDQPFHEPWRRQRRIPLQVHNDVKAIAQRGMGFGTTLRAVGTGRRGHHNLGSKSLGRHANAIIIGRHHDPVHTGHRHGRAPAPLNQRLRLTARAFQRHQRLTRIACRRIARGNGNQDRHQAGFRSTEGAYAIKKGLA
mmetsp:Transcript_17998/g.27418  ORF Transcript_17998/g.27418 Transcript_17998/m.27418 type:complete len:211 (+) Transcript_17998:14712-15344(+)